MGTYHAGTSGENQDVLYHGENSRFSVIALADGVSSCRMAKTGAEIAAHSLTGLLLRKGRFFFEIEKRQIAQITLSHIIFNLKKHSETTNEAVEEYSSTVAAVLVDKKSRMMMSYNLGDGMILASTDTDECHMISRPSDFVRGCCVTTTEGAENMVSVGITEISSIDSVTILSDGAWKEIYRLRNDPLVAKKLLSGNNSDELTGFFSETACFDDCSFISMKMSLSGLNTGDGSRKSCAWDGGNFL